MKTEWTRLAAVAPMVALTGSLFFVSAPAQARSFAQKHPIITGAAAGIAAHHYAKKWGRRRTMHGRHRNFAERHPVLTGAAAAAAAHHVAKRHH